MIKLMCPFCGNSDKIQVKQYAGIFELNCPNHGTVKISIVKVLKRLEEHVENCQCGTHRKK